VLLGFETESMRRFHFSRRVRRFSLFVECPNCRKLLDPSITQCPECRELIDKAYARASALVVAYNSAACGFANDISAFDVAAGLYAVLSVYVYFGSPFLFKFTLWWPVLPLIWVGSWFRRFGRFKLGDERYLKARQNMKDSLKKWILVCALQLVLLVLSEK
jgi:hypothetical protein